MTFKYKISLERWQAFIQKLCKRCNGCGCLELWNGGWIIHDIPTCKELIERVVSEAEEIIALDSQNCCLNKKILKTITKHR